MKAGWVIAGLAALMVGARLCLPYAAKARLNGKLAGLSDGYSGEVQGVRLALWRGSVVLRDLKLSEEGAFFKLNVPELEINLAWGPLLRRRMLVASVTVLRPSLQMKVAPAKKILQVAEREVAEKARELKAKIGERQNSLPLPALLEELMPFRLDRLLIVDGEALVREGGDEAEAKFYDIQATVENLTNAAKWTSGPQARAKARARLGGTATLKTDLELNPTARQPDFHVTLEVDKMALKDVNPLLRSEWGVDVETGTFDLYAEVQAKDGAFKGYVKPFVKGLKIHGARDKGAFKIMKEAVIGAVASVLKNEDSRAVASKVPFEGRFEDPDVGLWRAVFSVLRNAFVKALGPSFDAL